MIPEREREALMRLTMCARIECDICKYKDSSIDECDERITENMNILADALKADRKTESLSEYPTSSDEPQTCQECEHWNDTEDGCADRHGCKTGPTGYNLSPVDKDINVRSKDEPQTEPLQTCSVNGRPYSECSSCEHFRCTADEPQTERSNDAE